MGFTLSFYLVLFTAYVWVFSNLFIIERAWRPVNHCQLWACYAHSHCWWEQIPQDVICFCSPLTYLYEVLGLPQSVITAPACSPNISSLCISVYVQYVQLPCAPVCREISSYLTAELVLPLLLTKDFLFVILAQAELDMLQSVWEWVWALGRGALTRQNNNISAKWNAA